MELSTRDLRTVTRDVYPRRLTVYSRRTRTATTINRPGRGSARRAAIAASIAGL